VDQDQGALFALAPLENSGGNPNCSPLQH